MKRFLTVLLLFMMMSSMASIQAKEASVEITSEVENIDIYPGMSKTFTVFVRSNEDQSEDPSGTNPPSTTNPPTTVPPTTPGPPPPPANIAITGSLSSSLSMSAPSMSMSFALYSPNITVRADAPDGFTVEFESDSLAVSYDTDVGIDVRITAAESVEVGDYVITITTRSNTGHYDSVDINVSVLPYIDVAINEVTINDSLLEDGDNAVFTANISNKGEDGTGSIICAIYEKETNKRIASKEFMLGPNETRDIEIGWAAVEGLYNFRVFVSSPENERVTTNNYFFLSLKVGPAFMPVDKGEEYFSQGLIYYESMKWQEAIDSFGQAIVEFEKEGNPSKLNTSQIYIDISQKYLLARNLYQEGIQAIDDGNFELAKDKLHEAELIYTELGDIDKISLCFNAIIGMDESYEDKSSSTNESSAIPYPWYIFTIPVVMIVVFLGYTRKSKPSINYDEILETLKIMRDRGSISEEDYIKKKYKIKMKMLDN